MLKKILPIIILILVVILVISGYMIAKELRQSQSEQRAFEELKKDTSSVEEETVFHKRNLEPLFTENPDCIGWIYIEDTEVDYPVMHTPSEPQKYLRRNFDGEDSTGGVPFLQENTTLTEGHLIIYGHNMRNGSMFADVTKYAEGAYCEMHPTIEFEIAEGVRYYDVSAVALLDKYDDWYGFVSPDSEEMFDTVVAAVMEKALYQTEVTPVYGKQILTLSTCYGDNDDDRIVVIATER